MVATRNKKAHPKGHHPKEPAPKAPKTARPKRIKITPTPALTIEQIEWLKAQHDCIRPMGRMTKPVNWKKLSERMESEAKLGNIISVPQDNIGYAWNEKIWRFDGQEDIPAFNGGFRWSEWIVSQEGKEWREQYA